MFAPSTFSPLLTPVWFCVLRWHMRSMAGWLVSTCVVLRAVVSQQLPLPPLPSLHDTPSPSENSATAPQTSAPDGISSRPEMSKSEESLHADTSPKQRSRCAPPSRARALNAIVRAARGSPLRAESAARGHPRSVSKLNTCEWCS